MHTNHSGVGHCGAAGVPAQVLGQDARELHALAASCSMPAKVQAEATSLFNTYASELEGGHGHV